MHPVLCAILPDHLRAGVSRRLRALPLQGRGTGLHTCRRRLFFPRAGRRDDPSGMDIHGSLQHRRHHCGRGCRNLPNNFKYNAKLRLFEGSSIKQSVFQKHVFVTTRWPRPMQQSGSRRRRRSIPLITTASAASSYSRMAGLNALDRAQTRATSSPATTSPRGPVVLRTLATAVAACSPTAFRSKR